MEKKLITSDIIAVVELIKNSFDADSTKVTLTLDKVTNQEEGKIIVEDDGVGMHLETVLNVWLEPGTEFRRLQRQRGEKSRVYGRPLLGEKGIGRFAAHRLGNVIELITRSENDEFEVEVEVNWRMFESSKYLSEVPINWMKRKPQVFTGNKHGTKLIIQDLKKPWTEEMIGDLSEKLDALQAPLKEKYNFETIIVAPEFKNVKKKIIPLDDILKVATYSFQGYVDENGSVDGKYFFNQEAFPNEARSINLKDNLWKNIKKFTSSDGSSRLPRCGPFTVRFYAWDLDPISMKETVTRKYYENNIQPLSGVRVFRDGFRVWPYGERGNDWLNLDIRRVNNPSKCLSNNQTIGLVNIAGRENADLQDKTDREGMIDNPAYADFKDLVLSAISSFEVERNRDKLKIASLRRKSKRFDKTIEAISVLREKMKKRNELGDYEKEINAVENAYETEIKDTVYPLIVSAGVGIAYMMPAHEIIDSIDDLEDLIDGLERELVRLDIGGRIAKTTAPMKKITAIVKDVADGALELTRRKSDVFSLKTAIDSSIDIKEPSLITGKIKVTVIEKNKIQIKGYQNLVMTCVLNLIENSIYWLSESKEKCIQVTIDYDSNGNPRIIVSDTGPGIRKEDLPYLGEAYWTRKPFGTGLGLFISKRAMNANGGSIEFGFYGEEPGFLTGANVILKFSPISEIRR